MPARRNGTRIARNLLVGVAVLLVAGIAGSLFMGVRAQRAQVGAVVEQATNIADRSLGLVFHPDDLAAPVSSARAADLDARVAAAVLDPSSFQSVTLWSQDGQILYSTQGRIGNTLESERDRVREALRGIPQTQNIGGTFSVMVPLSLRSGVGLPTAVELTTSAGSINAAPQPWRTNALFLLVLLAFVGIALYREIFRAGSGRSASAVAVERASAAGHVTSHGGRPVAAPPSPGLREEGDARRKAEDRARAAEERLATLQGQYRNTLEELQTSQRRIQEQAAAARPIHACRRSSRRPSNARASRRSRPASCRRGCGSWKRSTASWRASPPTRRWSPPPRSGWPRSRASATRCSTSATPCRAGREGGRARTRGHERTGGGPSATHWPPSAPSWPSAPSASRPKWRPARPTFRPPRTRSWPDGRHRPRQRPSACAPSWRGAQTQLTIARRELESSQELGDRTKELQEDLDAAHVDTLRNRESFEVTRTELQAAQAELDDARTELRALRTEEQRAAMLEDELRATKAELESAVASHRAELVERETEFEGKVRTAREEFQGQIASLETRHEDDLATRDRRMATRLEAAETAAAAKVERVRQELTDRDARYGVAEQVVAEAKEEASRLGEELAHARLELDETVQRLLSETNSVRELSERTEFVQREATDASTRAERLAEELDDATQSNADLNRRLQELESRRALEIANVEGRADLDQLLRVTQERLAGQTERLIAAEDNAHRLERELKAKLEQIDQIEGELRHVQMAEAMRQIRGEGHEAAETADESEGAALPAPPAGLDADGLPFEDRRATSPFMKELSHDARKSLTQILGLTQILKHKKDAKEQAQLVRQLTTYARRLDHVVSDMADADKLVRGTVELTVRRTDLEALVHRVVEESGVGSDHEVHIDAERVVVALDQLRTEQILAGLLRSAADRTPLKRPITVRLENHDGGALLSVEDPEPSSDASLSPVVQRFAEMQGGWAKVESGPEGGSAFRVFLPDGAKASEDAPIVVADQEVEEAEEQEAWSPDGAQLLVQELHRLSEISAED